jgi:hypothetical protein
MIRIVRPWLVFFAVTSVASCSHPKVIAPQPQVASSVGGLPNCDGCRLMKGSRVVLSSEPGAAPSGLQKITVSGPMVEPREDCIEATESKLWDCHYNQPQNNMQTWVARGVVSAPLTGGWANQLIHMYQPNGDRCAGKTTASQSYDAQWRATQGAILGPEHEREYQLVLDYPEAERSAFFEKAEADLAAAVLDHSSVQLLSVDAPCRDKAVLAQLASGPELTFWTWSKNVDDELVKLGLAELGAEVQADPEQAHFELWSSPDGKQHMLVADGATGGCEPKPFGAVWRVVRDGKEITLGESYQHSGNIAVRAMVDSNGDGMPEAVLDDGWLYFDIKKQSYEFAAVLSFANDDDHPIVCGD